MTRPNSEGMFAPQDLGIGHLFESIRDAVIVAEADTGRIVLWNPAATEIFGYSASEALELNVEVLVPERLKKRHRAGISRYRDTGHGPFVDSNRVLDLPAIRKDGAGIRVELTLSPIEPVREAETEGRFVLAIVRDVTRRRRAEEEVRLLNEQLERRVEERTARLEAALAELGESEERYRLLVEGAKDYAIFMLDTEGRVTNWNTGAQRLFGYEEDEIVGEYGSVLFTPEDLQKGADEEELRRAEDGGRAEDERWHVRKDGSRFWSSGFVRPVRDEEGNLRGFAKVARDITERKEAEDRLRESEERFRATFEQAAVGVAHVSTDGRLLRANDKLCEIFGYTREEVLGLALRDISYPEDLDADLEYIRQVLAGEMDSYSMEKRYFRKDGGVIWTNLAVSVVRGPSGDPEYFIGAIEDVTERKRAEEDRERLLLESERREAELRAVIESIPDALYIGDENGITMCNDAALEMLGFGSVEELNEQIHLLAERLETRYADTGERIPPGEEPFDRALRGETCAREMIARHLKTGQDVILRSAAAPIRHEGRTVGAVAVNTDITERKRAEEELRRHSERITNILESITDAFYALARDWRFTYLNTQAEALVQRRCEELLGKNVWEEFPEAVGSTFYEKYHEALASGEPVQFEEFYAPLGGWFEVKAYPSEEGLSIYFRDVTERRKAQESLRRYAAILDATTDFVGTADRSGRALSVNRAGRRMIGIGDKEDITRTTIADYHPEWARAVILEQGVPAAIRDGSWSGETALISRDGREIPVSQVILAHRGSQGEVEYLSTVARDITERKRAEEELRARAHQQGTVADLGRRALAITDLRALMDEVARSTARTLGVEYCQILELLPNGKELLLRAGVGWKEGSIGRATVDAGLGSQAGYALLSDAPVVVEDLPTEERFSVPRHLREHGVVSSMSAIIRGREHPFGILEAHTRERRVFTEDDVYFLRAVANVLAAAIERGRAEEELREQEAVFRSLSASSPVGIFLTDLRGRCTYTNPRCQEICGFSHEEALGEGWANFVHPEDREWVFKGWSEYAREGCEYSDEFRFVNFRSGIRWVHVRSAPMFLDGGEPIGHVGTVEDITERKKAEEAMRQIREAERTRIARDLHDGVLQDLAYTVQTMEFTKLQVQGTDVEEELQEELEAIRSAVRGIRAAVHDLRLADEVDQPFPRLVESLVERNREMAQGSKMELVVGRGVPSESFGGSGVELLRIIQEALTNARRHSHARNVLVTLRIEGEALAVEISDDGRGFGPDIAPEVGLRSMRERATLLGGELEVHSEPGEGTTVRLRIPMPGRR